jgi:hypothetical protein
MEETINLSFLSADAFASLAFFLSATFVLIVTLVMFFHWRKYGLGGPVLALVEVVYLSVSAVLLAVAFFSLN